MKIISDKLKNTNKKILAVSFAVIVFFIFCCTSRQKNQTETDISKNPLEHLIDGNKRFKENHPIHPDQTLERLRELKKGQHPFAVVVSCSDSRVPPELIFDQGLGDLFVVRNAGNIISDYEFGSIEYAVEHLGTKLIVVLGHTNCGAIDAFIKHKHDGVHNHIQSIIDYIKSEPEEAEIDVEAGNYYEMAVIANVKHGVHVIEKSEPILKEFIQSGKIQVVGMLYDINTGSVEILKN